jgi:hypothetical protein
VYPQAEAFLSQGRRQLQSKRNRERERSRAQASDKQIASGELKSIDAFRANPRYGGNRTRIVLGYAIYPLSRRATELRVEVALRSGDLSHKGRETAAGRLRGKNHQKSTRIVEAPCSGQMMLFRVS